jgi:hypothetical protein
MALSDGQKWKIEIAVCVIFAKRPKKAQKPTPTLHILHICIYDLRVEMAWDGVGSGSKYPQLLHRLAGCWLKVVR